jgi:hypothetical protein
MGTQEVNVIMTPDDSPWRVVELESYWSIFSLCIGSLNIITIIFASHRLYRYVKAFGWQLSMSQVGEK